MSKYTKTETVRTIICDFCNRLYPDEACEPADCDWLRMLEEDATIVPQWISVKDKLPEPEQDVLVIAHGWGNRLLYIGSYQRAEAETSWLTGVTSKASDWSLWGWSYLKEPEVTHWMPLPDPPKDTETACRRKECGT